MYRLSGETNRVPTHRIGPATTREPSFRSPMRGITTPCPCHPCPRYARQEHARWWVISDAQAGKQSPAGNVPPPTYCLGGGDWQRNNRGLRSREARGSCPLLDAGAVNSPHMPCPAHSAFSFVPVVILLTGMAGDVPSAGRGPSSVRKVTWANRGGDKGEGRVDSP